MLPSNPEKMHPPLAHASCLAQARWVIDMSHVVSGVGLLQSWGADSLGSLLGHFPALPSHLTWRWWCPLLAWAAPPARCKSTPWLRPVAAYVPTGASTSPPRDHFPCGGGLSLWCPPTVT